MKKLKHLLLMFLAMVSASIIPLKSAYADNAAKGARKLKNPRANTKALKANKQGD